MPGIWRWFSSFSWGFNLIVGKSLIILPNKILILSDISRTYCWILRQNRNRNNNNTPNAGGGFIEWAESSTITKSPLYCITLSYSQINRELSRIKLPKGAIWNVWQSGGRSKTNLLRRILDALLSHSRRKWHAQGVYAKCRSFIASAEIGRLHPP